MPGPAPRPARSPWLRIAAACALLPLAAACGTAPAADPTSLHVVATAAPLGWLARAVVPDARVTVIGAGGADPHAHDLTPEERVAIAEADLVVGVGPVGFQPSVEEALRTRSGATVLATDVAGEARLLAPDAASAALEDADGGTDGAGHGADAADDHGEDDHGTDDQHTDHPGTDDEGAADPDAEDHTADDGHGHGSASVDPHVWFDAAIMADLADAFGQALGDLEPAHADAHVAAAAGVAETLRALGAEAAARLSACERTVAVVSHEAFGYLLHPHGLRQAGVSPAGGEVEASPRRVAALADLVASEGLPAVLADPHVASRAAEAVARAAGVEVVAVSALDALPPEAAAAGYPALLRQQVDAFADVLGCDPA